MFVKSSSTGKPKVKQSQLIRMTECSTCPKLLPNKIYKKDHERPQPIKIAQLLGQSENLKSLQKNSVHKKVQPERIGTFSSIKSIKINEKQSERSTSGQHTSTNKCVRRILNFNEISINNTKDNKENKNHSNKSVPNKPFYKSISKPIKKKSLLQPPNTIKDKHLQKCNEKEIKHSTISEISKNGSIIIESLNSNINPIVLSDNILIHNEQRINQSSDYRTLKFIEHEQHFKALCITPQSLSSSECKSSQQIITNDAHNNADQIFTQDNSLHEKLISNKNSLKSDMSEKLKEADNVQNLCNKIQDSKLGAENDTNIEHKPSKMMYINMDNIICLERNLKDLLKETERHRIKLKSTLTHVTRLLSINNEENTLSNIELKKGNNIMKDKEVQVDICCKSTQYSEEQLKSSINTLTPQIVEKNVETLNKNMLNQDDENKKNTGNENTTRMSDITTDGSFLELENQLNINYARATQNYSIRPKIPKITKYKQKQSFREYMALKSNISFLETPDGKKIRSLCQVDNMDKSLLSVTYISNKLLTDLHNLYSESPES